jgi:hypothetical protein
MTTAASSFLTQCPTSLNSAGRFFAVNEVKALLARIIIEYEIKFQKGEGLPHPLHFGPVSIPRNADILFRRRQK